jgi:hypothetical protein
MVRAHQEWRKTVLDTKVHNKLNCLSRRDVTIQKRDSFSPHIDISQNDNI